MITRLAFLVLAFAAPAMAASLDLANDPASGEPGKFAAEEIRREAAAKGMTLAEDANATRISITVEKDGKAAAQSYRIITVRGADAAGEWAQRMVYGGARQIGPARTEANGDVVVDLFDPSHFSVRLIKRSQPVLKP